MQVVVAPEGVALQPGTEACSICGDTRKEIVYRDCRCRRRSLSERFDLFRCLGCGVAYLYPQPSLELLSWLYYGEYQSHSASGQPVGGFLKAIRALCMVPYRLRFGREDGYLSPFGESRLLDIGCGTGDYLATMAKRGWQCLGCDVSGPALSLARRKVPNATLYHGRTEDLPFQPNSFEAVSLWHALEHLEDPPGVLRYIHDLLVPGGTMIIAVPNIDSWEARVLGKRWVEIDIPGHLHFFSRTTLSALLERMGFECVRVRPQIHPSTVSDSLGFFLDDLLGVKRARQRMLFYYVLFPLSVASCALGN